MTWRYKNNKKILLKFLYLILLVFAVMLVSGFIELDKEVAIKNTVPATPGYYKVVSVEDGDTITVNMDGRDEKIRFIGVDTPETIKPNSPVECYGPEASNHLKKLLEGQTVKLEADPTNQNRDRYGRLLRYVYTENSELVNKIIIKNGYGFAYLSFPFIKSEEFRQAQLQAQNSNIGVWGSECKITDPNGDRPKTNSI